MNSSNAEYLNGNSIIENGGITFIVLVSFLSHTFNNFISLEIHQKACGNTVFVNTST